MYVSTSDASALVVLAISIVCWGSWATTVKSTTTPLYHYFWDFVLACVVTALVTAFTFGGTYFPWDNDTLDALNDYSDVTWGHIVIIIVAAICFCLAILVLLAAIRFCGMAVSMLIVMGMCACFGTLITFSVHQSIAFKPFLIGIVLSFIAVMLSIVGFKELEQARAVFFGGEGVAVDGSTGLKLCVVSGILMSLWEPLISLADGLSADSAVVNPYLKFVLFTATVVACSIPLNLFFISFPIANPPANEDGTILVDEEDPNNQRDPLLPAADRELDSEEVKPRTVWDVVKAYFTLSWSAHLYGVCGGFLWSIGTLCCLLVQQRWGATPGYALSQSAALMSAFLGISFYGELKGSNKSTKQYIGASLLMYATAITALAVAIFE